MEGHMNSCIRLAETPHCKLQYTVHISGCPLLTHMTILWQK